jgi:branched-chain amino acid transport system permease protein
VTTAGALAVDAALGLGLAYALLGAAVSVVAVATRTLYLAVGAVLVAGVLVALVVASPVLGLPAGVGVVAGLATGAALSAALGPLVLDRLPAGATWLVGLVVAAGVVDAATARGLTAQVLRPAPLLPLPGLGPAGAEVVSAEVVVAVAVGAPAVALLAWSVTRTRWGRRVRLVGAAEPVAERCGIAPSLARMQALAVGGAAAVLAGLLAAPIATIATGQAGALTVRGVAAAALLGAGGPVAAVLGGLLLGAVEVAGATWWPAAGGEVAVTVLVVGVLALRGGAHLRAWGRAW